MNRYELSKPRVHTPKTSHILLTICSRRHFRLGELLANIIFLLFSLFNTGCNIFAYLKERFSATDETIVQTESNRIWL